MDAKASGVRPSSAAELWYRDVLLAAQQAGIPFLVGGAAALKRYTGIHRDTKDIDLFLVENDVERFLKLFADRGHRTELTYPHWLGKVFLGEHFADLIFSSDNGIAKVDQRWFEYAVPDEVCGVAVQLIPVEEMIWSKSFVQERERYDGADIAHLLRARGKQLDGRRLLERFDEHWRVLLSHLILFGFVYPAERAAIPAWTMRELIERLSEESEEGAAAVSDPVCRGMLLSRKQYLPDFETGEMQGMPLARRGDEVVPKTTDPSQRNP